jgi:hypothetical protein
MAPLGSSTRTRIYEAYVTNVTSLINPVAPGLRA